MPVHVTVQFNLTAHLDEEEEEEKTCVCAISARPCCYLQPLCCLFFFQEHMILCRFADQTAVQLPPERRLIGRTAIHY